MNVGFVVAMDAEYSPFLSRLGKLLETKVVCGIEFCRYEYHKKTVFLAKCGIGEIASSAATALLIGYFECVYIVNFGLVGSLDGRPFGTVTAVRDVVHYDCDITAFGHLLGAPADIDDPFLRTDRKMLALLAQLDTPLVRLASGDKFIADPAVSAKIKEDFSAEICDMEGAGIALVCTRARVPFTMIKLVSDGADDNATSSFEKVKARAYENAFDLVLSVISEVSNE